VLGTFLGPRPRPSSPGSPRHAPPRGRPSHAAGQELNRTIHTFRALLVSTQSPSRPTLAALVYSRSISLEPVAKDFLCENVGNASDTFSSSTTVPEPTFPSTRTPRSPDPWSAAIRAGSSRRPWSAAFIIAIAGWRRKLRLRCARHVELAGRPVSSGPPRSCSALRLKLYTVHGSARRVSLGTRARCS
jgi:hypothetical protein